MGVAAEVEAEVEAGVARLMHVQAWPRIPATTKPVASGIQPNAYPPQVHPTLSSLDHSILWMALEEADLNIYAGAGPYTGPPYIKSPGGVSFFR